MKESIQILVDARELLSNEIRWCKHEERSITDAGYAYCLGGAVFEVCGEGSWEDYRPLPKAAVDALELIRLTLAAHHIMDDKATYDDCFVSTFNDHPLTNHNDILVLLDQVINTTKGMNQ